MKRFHVHVGVTDIPAAVAFYSKLFDAEPSVVETDYAKWMLEEPRINFAISTRAGKTGLDHPGFQADSEDEMETLHKRGRGCCRPSGGAEGCGVLLRGVRQVLDPGSGRNRLGALPHPGARAGVRRTGGSACCMSLPAQVLFVQLQKNLPTK